MDLARLLSFASYSPHSIQPPDAWIGHLPFAAWVMSEKAPKIFVELGVHSGNSYFSFCQAVLEYDLSTKCYAVDTWLGDEHAGKYGEEIYVQVNAYHQQHFAGFSRLMRMTFDDALEYFSDSSVGLLHIDGSHSYNAVRHDFETWLPKLEPGAVVIFHDINVRELGFGVWKFWGELKSQYPNNIEFLHSHGLGVLQLNDASAQERLDWLLPASPERKKLVQFFAALGARQLERYELNDLKLKNSRYEVTIQDKEREVSHLNQQLLEHAGNIDNLKQVVGERDDKISSLSQAIAERDGQIASLNHVVAERDGQINSLNQAVAEREGQIADLTQAVTEREGQIASLTQAATQREGQIASLTQGVTDREGQIADLTQAVTERDGQIAGLNNTVAEREARILDLIQQVADREAKIIALQEAAIRNDQALHEMQSALDSVHTAIGERDHKITSLVDTIAEHEKKYRAIVEISAAQKKINEELMRVLESHDNLSKILYLLLRKGYRSMRALYHWCMQRIGRWFENEEQRAVRLIESSGLFMADWYLLQNPDVAAAGVNPLVHFMNSGWKEGRKPNPLFDTTWYLEQNPDVADARINPLLHFINTGWREDRKPNPLFNPVWYVERHPDVMIAHINPLSHFIVEGAVKGYNPGPEFDTEWYLEKNPDVALTGQNPLDHYLNFGIREGRKPCPPYKGQAEGITEGVQLAHIPLQDRLLFYENEQVLPLPETDVKIMAFYFPQFHPFVENDTFWGKGFTEWTNVTKAQPLFNGHLQPRLPGELGFYDTRIKAVLQRQIELAKTHGIYGICFHHYWFMGRRVMRVPYNTMLENPDLDIPFCLHWANEPWTVRWDGFGNKGVLLDQRHSPDDDIAFIQDIEPALRDPRYIRINGRPLLVVYRPSLFPDMRATIDRWNSYCESEKIGKLYLAVMQTAFEVDFDPTTYGFDAAIEYPPHNMEYKQINHKIILYDKKFSGNVFSYNELVDLNKKRRKPSYTLFRGLVPGWDCTPRRRNPDLIIDQSPWKYQEWLESHIAYTKKHLPPAERFIFINAWNEWAEGAYLDPDRHFGYAYLNATGRALRAPHQKAKIAVVLHIHFTEFLDEFIGYFKNIPFEFDLHVSTSHDKLEHVKNKLFAIVGDKRVKVTAFPNQGRDMGPFIVGFKNIYSQYDYVCFVHSKNSAYGTKLEKWRTYLLNNLLGSADIVQEIIRSFENDPKLGMLAPDTFPPVASMREWGSNHRHVEKLAGLLGIEVDFTAKPDFPSGSMFWFRPKALQPLFELGIGFNDFEDGSEKIIDGTLAHAFERLFFKVVERTGFFWRRMLFVPEEKDNSDPFELPIKEDMISLLNDKKPKIAVILHLYYDDLADEVQSYLNNIPLMFDLFITVRDQADTFNIRDLFSKCLNIGRLDIRKVPNRGRDIYPFITVYDDVVLKSYDFCCKIHTKKSVFHDGHNNWRKYIFDNLLGSSQIVRSILCYFIMNERLGIVYPRTYLGVKAYNEQDPWRNNWTSCEKLSRRLNINISRGMSLDFPSGSMFWFRPSALRPLHELRITQDDFEEERGQLDGTFAHALERMFGLITEDAGYSIRKVLFREEDTPH